MKHDPQPLYYADQVCRCTQDPNLPDFRIINPSCELCCTLSRYVRRPNNPNEDCRVYGKRHSGVKL